jgi:hypothetical protein
MAVHYPAEYNIFSLVRIEAEYCKPKDENIIKYVSEKLGMDFIATAESDITLFAMRDLEQKLGKEIIWVTGNTFEKVNRKFTGDKGLPNQMWRFCTTEMKLRPIWDWWYKNIGEKVKMGIGFRYDEMERADRLSTKFKGIVGKRGTKNKWEEIEWREGWFPLIEDKIIHPTIIKWAGQSKITFPCDSNCVGCFWKPVQQLRKNWDNEPKKMRWFAEQENESKRWKKEMNYNKIKDIAIQSEFIFGTGSGCQAGYCTD